MQLQTYFIISMALLIILIVALIIIIVLRDQREMKTKQFAADLSQLKEVVGDLRMIKGDLAPALASFKKHEAALFQIDGHLKQISSALANLEHRQQPAGQQPAGQQPAGQQPVGQQPAGMTRERQGDRRDRDHGPRPGKGKPSGGDHPDSRRKEYSGAPREAGETVAINDGEKYAKVTELAERGLTAQEISKRLNVGAEEVSLVLELKGKRPV
jgi:hypothetical protein